MNDGSAIFVAEVDAPPGPIYDCLIASLRIDQYTNDTGHLRIYTDRWMTAARSVFQVDIALAQLLARLDVLDPVCDCLIASRPHI